MTSSKSTKRALFTSALAILMCVAMLIGTTFAWFTDTASTGVNKIQAGNLDIEVSFAKEAKNDDGTLKGELTEFKTIENATDVFDNNALWEPGRIEYVVFKIENKGNLALKYKFNLAVIAQKAGINVANEKYMLADYLCASAKIDNEPGVAGSGYGNTGIPSIDAFMAQANDLSKAGYDRTATPAEKPLNGINLEGNLEAGKAKSVCMAVWMPTTVGNEANAIDSEHAATIDLGIHVVATQYTYEKDSFDDQYDKDAEYLMYPSGVTAKSFEEATSVAYTDVFGKVQTGNKPAVAAYVDSNGATKYAADVKAAVTDGATVIYCKKDADMKINATGTNRTEALTNDLTIYANGADFDYGEIALNSSTAGPNTLTGNVDIKVYDAKNIKIWGNTPADGVTWNIEMVNCRNIGKDRIGNDGILMYITGSTNGTVNATVKNCYVTANSSAIYMTANGSLNVFDSTFVDCATGIKISYKGNGTRNDRIENCVFTNCGCTAEMAGSTTWLKDDSAAYTYKKGGTGTISLTTKDNTITGTIGDKGDTQVADTVEWIKK